MSVRIIQGGALEKLAELPDESVHCVVTSPPYYGLRKYKGDPGMIGLEPTLDEHIEALVAVFREVWRVLRKDGVVWLNYANAYWSNPGSGRGGGSTLQGGAPHLSGSERRSVPQDAPSSGSGYRGLRDCPESDCVCSGLCGECQAAIRGHYRTVRNDQHHQRSSDVSANEDQGTAHRGCSQPGPSPHDAQGSSTRQSLPEPLGACSRGQTPQASVRPSAPGSWPLGARLFVCTGCGRGTDDTLRQSRILDCHTNRGPSFSALDNYATAPHKPKDLINMSAFVVEALRRDGWWLRSEIVWHKTNATPESATNRPTNAHEKIYLLAKSGAPLFWTHRGMAGTRAKPDPDYIWRHRKTREERLGDPGDPKDWYRVNLWSGHDYFYDHVAVRTHSREIPKAPDSWDTAPGTHGTIHREGREKGRRVDKQRGHSRRHAGFNDRWDAMSKEEQQAMGANCRNVWFPSLDTIWTIPTRPFKQAHFATFPPDLVVPCIEAGTSQRGACASCGAPWARDTERRPTGYDGSKFGASADQNKPRPRGTDMSTLGSSHGEGVAAYETAGWNPTCDCGDTLRPCVILDPFAGAGTVGLVADRLGRDAILIEISDEYAKMAGDRIRNDAPLFADVEVG